MNRVVLIRTGLVIEVRDLDNTVKNSDGEVMAKAVRPDDHSNWHWGFKGDDGKMYPGGVVYSGMPEVMQRKVILAIMKEFV